MSGSAYRTTAVPHTEHGDFDGDSACYAVYPPAIYHAGVASYVLVIPSISVGDVGVYPCDETGLLLSWHLLTVLLGVDHRRALSSAGWELEEVRRAVA